MHLPRSVILTASAVLIVSSARAANPGACADAAFQGQTSRNEHKLLEAREEFRACVQKDCPDFVQKDCAEWLDDVDKRLPSVVVSAKDPSGRDLVDLKVIADGRPPTEKLDGESLPMNPGHHAFVFERGVGGSATTDIVLTEGEKDRRISIVVAAKPHEPEPLAPPPAQEGRSIPWTVTGYAVAGL